VAAPKGETNAGVRVEHHDRDPILLGKHSQSLLGRGSDTLDVGLHATAHIQKEQDIDGHVLAGEIPDGHDAPIHSQNKIIDLQTGYAASVRVNHLRVDARQRHIALKDDIITLGNHPWCKRQKEYQT
jgi:hypothetical protein